MVLEPAAAVSWCSKHGIQRVGEELIQNEEVLPQSFCVLTVKEYLVSPVQSRAQPAILAACSLKSVDASFYFKKTNTFHNL